MFRCRTCKGTIDEKKETDDIVFLRIYLFSQIDKESEPEPLFSSKSEPELEPLKICKLRSSGLSGMVFGRVGSAAKGFNAWRYRTELVKNGSKSDYPL